MSALDAWSATLSQSNSMSPNDWLNTNKWQHLKVLLLLCCMSINEKGLHLLLLIFGNELDKQTVCTHHVASQGRVCSLGIVFLDTATKSTHHAASQARVCSPVIG